MKIFIFAILCCFHQYNCADQAEWTYNEPWTEKCASGLAQSPIDIDLSDLQSLNCQDSFQLQVVPNIGEVQAQNDYSGLNIFTGGDYSTMKVKFPGRTAPIQFKSLQFHIHVKSQHEIFGQQYDIEVHFVHSTTDTTIERSLAVVGFLFQVYDDADVKETTFFDLWQYQTEENKSYTWNGGQALANLLVQNNVYVNYDGSLTTPGCAQLVNWFVSTKIWKIKRMDLENIKNILSKIDGVNSIDGTNHRPVQKLNDRKINLIGLQCNLVRELTKSGLNQQAYQITTVVNVNNSPLLQTIFIIVLLLSLI